MKISIRLWILLLYRLTGVAAAVVEGTPNLGTGNDDRADVSSLDAQYFWFYQLPHLWQIGAAPSITADWKANSDNRWTVPLGIGVNKTFRIGLLPIRVSLEVHKTVAQPDEFGQDWNFRLVVIPIIPNMVKVWEGTEKLL